MRRVREPDYAMQRAASLATCFLGNATYNRDALRCNTQYAPRAVKLGDTVGKIKAKIFQDVRAMSMKRDTRHAQNDNELNGQRLRRLGLLHSQSQELKTFCTDAAPGGSRGLVASRNW